ncbi:MAG TPA: YbaK/EbsC family protein, partial [Anaerolineales bacterium]|nr:YbaK/EbsC family protein [Anaerolineales bacterium]
MSLSAPAQRVEAALRAKGFQGSILELQESTRSAADAARAVGCDVARIVKSLVFRTSRGAPILVLTSGAHRVDEATLREEVGEPIERADADYVRRETGFAIGGVPPVGHPAPIRTLIDRELMAHSTIWAAAGTPNAVFEVAPQDLLRYAGAEVVDVA